MALTDVRKTGIETAISPIIGLWNTDVFFEYYNEITTTESDLTFCCWMTATGQQYSNIIPKRT